MKIELASFGGMAPLVEPTKLQDHFASDAENVVFNRGVLSQNPLHPELESAYTDNSDLRSGIRNVSRLVYFDDGTSFGFTGDDTQDDNHGVGSLLAPRDQWDRKYYIRSGKVRVASSQVEDWNAPLTGAYTRNPMDYLLGVPAPKDDLIVGDPVIVREKDEDGIEDESPLDDLMVKWTYTVVDGFGHEGPPAPASVGKRVPYDAPWRVRLSGFRAVLENAHRRVGASFRIYRAAFDGATSAFQFVGEIPYGSNPIVYDGTHGDGVPLITGVALGEEMELIPSVSWDEPPQGNFIEGFQEGPLETVVSVASNFLAGYYRNYLCYSEFKMPHAWPTQMRFPLNYPIVGLLPLDNGVLIATKGKPYWGFGADPQSAVPVELSHNYPCIARRSLVDMGGYGVYATYDGLVGIEQGQARVLTGQHITREDWIEFIDPETMVAFAAEGRYYFSGKDGRWWVFDPADAAGFARVILGGIHPSAVRVISFDATRDRVMVITHSNEVYSLAVKESGPMTWDSKVFLLPPVSFSTARVEADTYPVQLVIERDKEAETYEVSDGRPIRLKPGLATEWKMGVRAGGGKIRKLGIAQSPEEFRP